MGDIKKEKIYDRRVIQTFDQVVKKCLNYTLSLYDFIRQHPFYSTFIFLFIMYL